VGTTFTIDLAAALVIPLSFAARDLGEHPDQIGVMEAIRSCAERVDVFYQAGKAFIPPANDLFGFLEPVLHPVRAPRPHHLFHPKVWILKYADPDRTPSYRLLCSTRNLTHDQSWDAVISLDGVTGSRTYAANAPIREFLRRLPELAVNPIAQRRAERIQALAEEVGRIEWEQPEDARELAFHALGVGSSAARPNFDGYRRLVVSPFVNDAGMGIVAPATQRGTVLVSRPEELDRLGEIPTDVELKVLSLLPDCDDKAVTELGGLHAKLTIVERGGNAHMFIGSANATDAAYGGNVEFLVEVVRGAKNYGVEPHLDLKQGMGVLLEPYAQQPAKDTREEDLRFEIQNALRRIAELDWTVQVVPSEGKFGLEVTSRTALPQVDVELTLGLLSRPGIGERLTPGEQAQVSIAEITVADITCFLTLTGSKAGLQESTVIPALLLDEPDGRLDAILARQVDTPEKFIRFVLLLLGLAVPAAAEGGQEGAGGNWSRLVGNGQGVFELLARALADGSRALNDIDRLVTRLGATTDGRDRLPEGFWELWQVVAEARQPERTAR
jgi:hypothetical protein